VLAGGVLLGAGLLVDGGVARPLDLYLAFGVLTALGVAAAGWVPAVILVQRWYPQRLGTVLGFTSAGIGVGIFVVVPVAQLLIDAVGWRDAFRALAVLVLLWIVPSAFWLLRDPPPSPPAPGGPRGGGGDVSLPQALATARFWLITLAQGAASFVNQMLLAHQVAYLVDHGVTTLVAASVVGVVGLGSIVGKAGGGWASDTFGREATYTAGSALVVASIGTLGWLALAPGVGPAYVYGALIGVGYAVTAPLMPAVVSDLYRGRNFGAIFGAVQVANALGGSAGPWVAGRIFDARGSYTLAFALALGAAVVSAVSLWIVAPRRGADRLSHL
jgi:MFS family permease